jgi:hypothetical protein
MVGVVLVVWIVSGLVMLLPSSRARITPTPPTDFSQLTITPAAAAGTALAERPGGRVRGVDLRRVGDRVAYVVAVEAGHPVLVDATDGHVVTVTESLAVSIATGLEGSGFRIASVRRADRHRASYFASPLPVWQVRFAAPAGLVTYVNALTGEVRRTTRRERGAAIVRSLHSFAPLNMAPGGNRARYLALWAASLVALGAAVLGYWLALPRRWRWGA